MFVARPQKGRRERSENAPGGPDAFRTWSGRRLVGAAPLQRGRAGPEAGAAGDLTGAATDFIGAATDFVGAATALPGAGEAADPGFRPASIPDPFFAQN